MFWKGMTVLDAAQRWVGGFNAFPQGMIGTCMNADPDSWQEITKPVVGQRVYIYELPKDYMGSSTGEGEIVRAHSQRHRIQPDDELFSDFARPAKESVSYEYSVRLDDGEVVKTAEDNLEQVFYATLPMWGTLWQFGDLTDNYWLEDKDGIRKLSSCGFRVYEHEDWGYFFGIDGAGYDFYTEHWVPLYRARGLEWHDPETEEGKQ